MSGTWVFPTNYKELTLEGLRETLKTVNRGLQSGRLKRIILQDEYVNIDYSLPDPYAEFDAEQGG